MPFAGIILRGSALLQRDRNIQMYLEDQVINVKRLGQWIKYKSPFIASPFHYPSIYFYILFIVQVDIQIE